MMQSERTGGAPAEKRPPQADDEDVVTSAKSLEELGVGPERPSASGMDENEKREYARMQREKALEALENDVLAKDKAQKDLEDAFFARGEKMSEAHEAGGTIAKNAAEMRGDAAQEADEMRARHRELLGRIAPLRSKAAEGAEILRKDFKIDDPEAALAERAKGGAMGGVKRFFGGLFNRGARERERALDAYDAVSNELADLQAEYNELTNRLERPDDVQAAMKLKAERNQPRPN